MPRIILTTDQSLVPQEISVLLDERVSSVHLSTDHAASQLIERLAWAITDAEDTEQAAVAASQPPAASQPRGRPRGPRRHRAPRALGVPGALAARS
jgi:hypothetical protein